MIIPDPKDYLDGVQFFRDMHKVVLQQCVELEKLLQDAEANGVFRSFAERPEWNAILAFFQKPAPQHERDEEEYLFPTVASHVPRVGFQQPDSSIRFLIEGHDILRRKISALVHDWEVFHKNRPDDASLTTAHSKHPDEDAKFVAAGRELVRLYREHIALEESRVYTVADKVLSGAERLELLDRLRDTYDNQEVTSPFAFEEPQFSDPNYNVKYIPTEAVADDPLEEGDEEESEDNILL